jgi:hypothetical protein
MLISVINILIDNLNDLPGKNVFDGQQIKIKKQ